MIWGMDNLSVVALPRLGVGTGALPLRYCILSFCNAKSMSVRQKWFALVVNSGSPLNPPKLGDFESEVWS